MGRTRGLYPLYDQGSDLAGAVICRRSLRQFRRLARAALPSQLFLIAAALFALGLQLTLASLRWQRIAEFGGGRLSAGRAVLCTPIGSFLARSCHQLSAATRCASGSGEGRRRVEERNLFGLDRSNCRLDLACCSCAVLPALVACADRQSGWCVISIGVAGAAARGRADTVVAWPHVTRTLESRSSHVRHRKNCLDRASLRRPGVAAAVISLTVHFMTVAVLWLRAGHRLMLYFPQFAIAHPPVILISASPCRSPDGGARLRRSRRSRTQDAGQ